MKSFKYLATSILVLISISTTKAQTTGRGCFVNNRIYTQYLGLGNPYGTPIRYYNSAGANLAINYNNYSSTKPNNYNYTCGQVNEFSGSNVGPAQDEFIETNPSTPCIISTSLVGSINGNGSDGTYSINKPAYCGTVVLPIDDYVWPIMLIFAAIGVIIIRKKGIF